MYTRNLMKKMLQLTALPIVLGLSACTSEDLLGPPGGTTTTLTSVGPNIATIAHDNFIMLASTLTPAVIDQTTFAYTYTEVTISIILGDRRNQKITGTHTIYFETEWGLIEPSCVTVDGECSVTWSTSTAATAPGDDLTTITAYTIGEESFDDSNGNFIFDVELAGNYRDSTEPFVDIDRDGVFDAGEPIIDTVNFFDVTGADGMHNPIDNFISSAGCDTTMTALCSINDTITIWNDLELDLNGPPP